MLLARLGYEVLLVDRVTFPSDHTMSTHFVWQDGCERLERWGLLGAAAEGCPAVERFTIDLGPFALTGCPPPAGVVKAAHAPRRMVLDKVLVDAAASAGAELRERCTLDEPVFDDGRVVGATFRNESGSRTTESASLVIGADGANSLVARLAKCPVRDEHPVYQGTSWSYWSGVPSDGLELYVRDQRGAYAFPTRDGLTLVGTNLSASAYSASRQDIEHQHLTTLQEVAPELAQRVEEGEREERWYTGAVPNIVRKAGGRGWALVGDAGCVKDPCTARGISDAFRDAELVADAVHAALGKGRAMADVLDEYEALRDQATLPTFEFTCQLAPYAPPPPEMQQLFAALRGNPTQTDRFWGVFAGTVSVPEFFSPANIAAIMAEASSA